MNTFKKSKWASDGKGGYILTGGPFVNINSINMSENSKPLASKEQIDDADTMRTVSTGIKMLINTINNRFPHPKGSREKSLVVTKLQEAIFWAEEDIKLNHKL